MTYNFKLFKEAVQKQFQEMIKGQTHLFVVDIDKDLMWETYLNSFPSGTNEIYRERREYDCSTCRHFIKQYGNIVAINKETYEIMSIWDCEVEYPYNIVADKMSYLIRSKYVDNIFISKFKNLGTDKSHEQLKDNTVCTWEHFYIELPNEFVDKSSRSIGDLQGDFKASKSVFKRSMEELTLEAGLTILDLIEQNSLYRGKEFEKSIQSFIRYRTTYNDILEENKDNWCWLNSINNPIAKIKNHAIGTLLEDLSKDIDIDEAVTKFERNVMAPSNYKRPKAIFTKKMVEEAEKKIEEMGLSNSLGRRFAVSEDIIVNNVLFANRDAKKKLNGSIFDNLKEDIAESSKKFDRVEEISIDDFVKHILPTTTNIELMMEYKHQGNLMSLIAPEDINAPTILKWNNNFSWSYNGNITDSMKQNVKNAGGNVEGVLRFSIQWNEHDDNHNDFDAHCIEPNGNEIYFGCCKKPSRSALYGQLDVDIIHPDNVAVENITWPDESKMEEGVYTFFVHNYSQRDGYNGFSAEIEFNGEIYHFDYPKELRQNEKVIVGKVLYNRKEGFKLIESLDSSVSSKEVWGIKTNKFNRVSILSYSPNYWDEQKGTGNRHYFFFLENCVNEGTPRGFYNEFLKEELMEHKRVFEALGSKSRVEPSNNQLSGLGFSSTQRNSILAKVEGNFSRVIRIKF